MGAVKEKLKKIKQNNNIAIQVFLTVAVVGYMIFFSSPLWFPASNDYVDATAYYEKVAYLDYEIYLTQWIYAKNDSAMQIIVELNNKGVTDKAFTFEAVEKTKGELQLEVVLTDKEYTVLKIENLDDTWKEISLRISEEGSLDQVKLYTNVDAVEQVESLSAHTKADYKIERLEAQIDYDEARIVEKWTDIKALQEENTEMTVRIEELNDGVYLSEQEAEEALDTIKRAENLIKSNEESILALQIEIEELEKRTENIREQIELVNMVNN